jgi:hypothetical protein
MKTNWIPEILYENDSSLPFICVPKDEKDPALLFIFVNRETGSFEPGPKGKELPIYDIELRQFADLSILKKGLSEDEYDKVRSILGLEKKAVAAKKGSEITKKVAKNIESINLKQKQT